MLGKIYTKIGEEIFISNVIKNSLNIDLPKYFILRLAINKSFRLSYQRLDHPCYSNFIPYDGVLNSGGEYNMAQVIGAGKEGAKDYTNILRAAFIYRHKDENLDFGDDSVLTNAIDKYIHRGLFELHNLYKGKDDFYQFLIDEFKDVDVHEMANDEPKSVRVNQKALDEYLKNQGIKAQILSHHDALRHDVFKLRFDDMKNYEYMIDKTSELKVEFGLFVDAMAEYANEQMSLNLYLPKPKNEWKNFGADAFISDIKEYSKKHGLPIYAGRDAKNRAFFFDLIQHILVGGTSGSGKSNLLHTFISSLVLLNKNLQLVLIDPKNGDEFGIYDGLINLSELADKKVVKDMSQVAGVLDNVINEMERRYIARGANKNYEQSTLSKIVVVIDELSDLFNHDKELQSKVICLVRKARAAGIHVIAATQSPNAETLKKDLRENFDLRVALKVQNSKSSSIVIDETGAENLLGAGDMLVKLSGAQSEHIFSPYLDKNDVREILKF